MQNVDAVIVGGGIGGCALGAALAEAGFEVLILERCETYEDRVRGEWIAPWGVLEAKRLGLYDPLIAAGGHHLSRHFGYDEAVDSTDAAANPIPIAQIVPDAPGPLCLEHVTLQGVACERAIARGARVRRGVSAVEVETGAHPRVRYQHEGTSHDVACRLIVGADGRASTVRRSLGIQLQEAPVDHLIAGLLVDGADAWPEDAQATGKAGDIMYLVFPQGGGKARLYADFDLSQRSRFSGNDGARRFLDAFDMACVPDSDALAGASPRGPCRAYPSQDAWTDVPFAEGGVLLGDAAGYNDPIIGQGLSITLRDARILRDLLTEGDWSAKSLAPYADERRERMRRLRFAAQVSTRLFARFDPAAIEQRERALTRLRTRPDLGPMLLAPFLGPEQLDASFFTDEIANRLFEA